MSLTMSATTIDCADAARLSSFWQAAVGGEVGEGATEAFAQLDAPGLTLCFMQVPEAKVTKNRVHLDLAATDIDAEVSRLEAIGARVVAVYTDGGRWTTMADVEGNEFCVVAS